MYQQPDRDDPTPSQESAPHRLDADGMQLVWECMSSMYGSRFLAEYGDSCTDGQAAEWARRLAGLTHDQLHHGLNACFNRDRANGYMPTLPEFRALCLGSADAPAQALTPEQREQRNHREHEADLAHFRKMRELAAGLGLDLWAHEAEHGIPHRARPPSGPTAYGRECAKNLGKFLGSFGAMP